MNGMEVLEIKKETAEEDYIYSAKEIWELCNTSKSSWDRFVAEFLSATSCEQKKDYVEEHPSRSGGNRYTEKTLKTFQAWLLRNQANQGRASDTIKEIVKAAIKNEDYIYSAKEIWELCNTSKRTWDNFVSEFLSATSCTQKF